MLLMACSGAPDNQEWHARIELASEQRETGHVTATVMWLGKTQKAMLVDTGLNGDKKENDGIFTAVFRGLPVRALPVTFTRHEGKLPMVSHRSVERLPMGGGTLSFAVVDLKNFTVQRLSKGGAVVDVERSEVWRTAAGGLWAIMGLLLALSMVPKQPRVPPIPDQASNGRWWKDGLLWLGLAILWTWPAVLAGGDWAVGRHFDLYGTIWSISAAERLLPSLVDIQTAWPLGAKHSAFDSFVLLPIGFLLQGFDPVQVHALLGVAGVTVSAWAAECFARSVGAARPWSMIAGLTFAFSGLAATALLEGHVYHIINPWLPLFALYWWRTCGPEASHQSGILAALFFGMTLLTTAYLGAAACIVAGGFLVGAGWRREARWPPIMVSILLMLPVVAWVYWGVATAAGSPETPHRILLGSTHLANFGIATPEIDRAAHSVSAGLGGLVFAASLLTPWFLKAGRWRVLYGTALVGLLFSFGPIFALDPETELAPSPTYLLWQLPVLGQLRFPIRLLWAWLLCAGTLTAVAATVCARSRDRFWVLPVVLLHAFAFVALPFRQSTTYAPTASIYAQSTGGPILELLGSGVDPSAEFENWQSASSCMQQSRHGRTIAEDCVSLPVQSNPRAQIQRWVEDRLRDGEAAIAKKALEEMGFGSVIWHPDIYAPGDRVRMRKALSEWPEPTVQTDGGGHLWLYRLDPAEKVDPSLPEDRPSIAHGMSHLRESDEISHAFIELQVTKDPGALDAPEDMLISSWQSAEYQVRYKDSFGANRITSITNDGSVTGDWPDDYTWTGLLSGPLSPRTEIDLFMVEGADTRQLWSGPAQINRVNDRIAFRRTATGARPTNVSADRPHPAARRGASTVALMGWSCWMAVLALWFVKRRRDAARLGRSFNAAQ